MNTVGAHETGQPTGEQRAEPANATWLRYYGLGAVAGGLLGISLSLLMSAAYHLTPEGASEAMAPWEPALRAIAEPVLTFAGPTTVYNTYGRVGFVVFAGVLAGLLGLRAFRRAGISAGRVSVGRTERWGLRLAMVGIALNLLGNVGDYWIGRPEALDFVAFLVGTVVGLLALGVGLALLGVAGLRSGSLARPVAWSLLLWLPAALLASFAGLNNIPGGAFLPLGVVGVLLGYQLWNASGTVQQDAPASDGTS